MSVASSMFSASYWIHAECMTMPLNASSAGLPSRRTRPLLPSSVWPLAAARVPSFARNPSQARSISKSPDETPFFAAKAPMTLTEPASIDQSSFCWERPSMCADPSSNAWRGVTSR